MSPSSVPIFRSSGQPGYSRALTDNPSHIVARKVEREVQVRFAERALTIESPEGIVHANPGDAIITGPAGETWRVSRIHFADKYRPSPSLPMGTSGRYTSLSTRILAVQMSEPFEVILADGRSHLMGRAGDWLVDYGDGSLGIVAEAIFPTTYAIER